MKTALDELKTISFHRENVLKRPKAVDLPTLEDADEHKLPAVNKLLLKIVEFSSELRSVDLSTKVDKCDHYPKENLFELTSLFNASA